MLQSSKLERMKFLNKMFILKYKPVCYFCKNEIDWRSLYPRIGNRDCDDITWHHLDLSGSSEIPNNNNENLVICHKSCHRKFHKWLDGKDYKIMFNENYFWYDFMYRDYFVNKDK